MYSLSSGFKVCVLMCSTINTLSCPRFSLTHTQTVYSIQYTLYSIQHTTEEEGTHTNHGRSKATVYGHGHVIVMCICLLDYKRIREDDGREMIEGIRRRDREVGSIRDREENTLENKQKQKKV